MPDAWESLPGTTGDAYERLCGTEGDAWSRLAGTVGDAWERLIAVCTTKAILNAVPILVQVKTVAARMVIEAETIGMWLMVFGLWIMLR